MTFISPKNIVVDFLRNRLTDPRERAEETNSESFDGGSTDFQLTSPEGTVSCISSVVVSGVTQTKWKNYRWDQQNQKLIFYSNTASGSSNVVVAYKYGTTNWIFPDKAKKSLGKNSFPRINLLVVGGSGQRIGQYNAPVESIPHFQIDVWTKEGQVFTIDSVKYADDKLSEYIAHQIMLAFRAHEDDLHPAFYNYVPLGIPRDMGFDSEFECFHTVAEVELQGLNLSESN